MKLIMIEPNIEGYALMPTMSLAILKSFINNKTRHEAKIIDLIFHKKNWKEYLKNRLILEKPDLVGISVLTFNYNQALEIASFIKSNFDVKIIFGGVHTILAPEEVIKNNQVDMVCIGEGELTLKDLLDKKINPEKVKGIWHKQNDKVIKNKENKLIEDLDNLPFPEWDDFDLKKYFLINNSHLPIMASRGCPYNCTYCSNHALRKKLKGKYVRFRSVDNVMEEIGLRIKQYYNRGLKYLFFYDDTFIIDRNFVLDFCKKFVKKGYNKVLKWNINVRADLVTEEIVKNLKEAGCYEVRMGVEAGNDYIRNEIYKRGMDKGQIFGAVKIIKKYGLHLRIQLIIGAPYETMDMMKESFEMAKKINADYELFPILMPLPATEIKEICEKEGLIEKKGFKNSHIMYTTPLTRTKYSSRSQIKKMVNRIKLYQIRKYGLKGLKLGGPFFILDLIKFFVHDKPKYDLEIDHAFRFTINKYNLAKLK